MSDKLSVFPTDWSALIYILFYFILCNRSRKGQKSVHVIRSKACLRAQEQLVLQLTSVHFLCVCVSARDSKALRMPSHCAAVRGSTRLLSKSNFPAVNPSRRAGSDRDPAPFGRYRCALPRASEPGMFSPRATSSCWERTCARLDRGRSGWWARRGGCPKRAGGWMLMEEEEKEEEEEEEERQCTPIWTEELCWTRLI